MSSDRLRSGQLQLALLANFADEFRGGIGIDLRRQPAGKTQRHSSIGGVTLTGQRERAVEIDRNPCHLPELTACLHFADEPTRGSHRPHRVGARRPDADLEQVEDTDVQLQALRGSGRA